MHSKTWILTLAGLTVLSTLAIAQGRAERLRDGAAQHDGRFARRAERIEHARHFVRSLELSDEQREFARREAQAVAPTVRAAREEARAIRDTVRGTQRDDPARALRERVRAEVAPHGRTLIDSLTPAQRARIEARLAARGRTFDVERASARVGLWLARPRVQEGARESRVRTR